MSTKAKGIALAAALASVFAALFALMWVLWQLHPWAAPGSAVHLGTWHFGDYEFQVWQRKTQYVSEPFADGFFARRNGSGWQAFCFDIQDVYRPRTALVKEGSVVCLIIRGKERARFDLTSGVFCRSGISVPFEPQRFTGDPPGNWWMDAISNARD